MVSVMANHAVSTSALKMKEFNAIQWERMATDNDNHAKLFNASFASSVERSQIVIIIDTYN